MIVNKLRETLPVLPAVLAAMSLAGPAAMAPAGALAAAEQQAAGGGGRLAGQMCPSGSYVIGFDAEGDIVCSQVCGNGVIDPGETCDDGNAAGGDGCSPTCQVEAAASATEAAVPARPGETAPAAAAAPAAASAAAAPAAAPPDPAAATTSAAPAAPAASPVAAPAVAELSIDDIEPSSVVYGKREVTITVTGSGFTPASVVLFNGSTYEPAIDPSGTWLTVTLPTRDLPQGNYAVTVSDGAGQKHTVKRALVVY